MKLTIFILCISVFGCFAVDSYSQSTKLSLHLENVTIKNALREIEEQSEFRFFFSNNVDVERKVSVRIQEKQILDILNELFREEKVRFNMIGRQIAIFNAEEELTSAFSGQQNKTITGKITNTQNEPVPGATIHIKGSTDGTITDIDGNYALKNVSADATLVFSFVGMKTQEVQVGGRTSINIQMTEETIGLEEVVAIGYGEQSRARLTTSVSKLDTEVLENAVFSNIGSALQGTISGLRVINTTGQPGTTPSILLRGGASINSPGSPLVVVDGVIRTMNDINSNDIESINVLKDAASTAIYGARANNGVILITSKKGKSGIRDLTYTFKAGVNRQPDDYGYVTAEEYIYYQRMGVKYTNASRAQGGVANLNVDAQQGYGFVNPDMFDIAKITNVNRANFSTLLNQGWQWMPDPYTNNQDTIVFKDYSGMMAKEAFNQNPQTQEHNISFSGGNDKSSFSLSLNYYGEDGLGRNTSYERFSGKLSSSYNLHSRNA